MNCPPIEELLVADAGAHLVDCETCRAEVDELLSTAARLAPDEGEFDDPDLARDVSTLIKLGHTSTKRAMPRWTRVVPAIAIAAAAALFFLPRNNPDGFASRSGHVEALDRWVSIDVFVANAKATGYSKARADLRTDDALVFSIENRKESPYRYAMVFAFDEEGRTYWYHPAYLDAADNPMSIAAPTGTTPLNEAVKHDLRPGWLRVVGLFSKSPLDVQTVEAALQGFDPSAEQRLPFDDTGQHTFLFRVVAP